MLAQIKKFTLIELTIVLVVIALIIGIATLKFGMVTEDARKTNCIANQKTVFGSVAVFDSKNSTVFADQEITTAGVGATAGNLAQYTSDTSAFKCPSSAAGNHYSFNRTGSSATLYAGVTCKNWGLKTTTAGPDGTSGTIHH